MKSENQTVVRCKQPIKIEKPPHGSRRCSVLVAAKKDGAIFKEMNSMKEEFLKLIFSGRG